MKYKVLLLAFFGFTVNSSFAQDTSFFVSQTHTVSIGYDFYKAVRRRAEFGPMFLKYEYRLFPNFGIGGVVHFLSEKDQSITQNWSFPNGQIGYLQQDYSTSGFAIMPKVNWRYLPFEYNANKRYNLELYAGVGIGYGFERQTKDVTLGEGIDVSYTTLYDDTRETSHFIAVEANVGARYYPIQNLGTYLEVGYGISFIQLGLIYTW